MKGSALRKESVGMRVTTQAPANENTKAAIAPGNAAPHSIFTLFE